jgi:hypothetical protein
MNRPSQRTLRATLSLLTLGLAAHALAACGASRTARIQYMHPSPLSRWGNRIRVEPFNGDPSGNITRRVEEVVRRSAAFHMVTEGAQMAVVGDVLEDSAAPDELRSHPHTCTREVPTVRTRQVPVVVAGLNPRVELRTEQVTEMVPQPYPCTRLSRTVDARFVLRLRINARTRPIHVVFDRRFELADRTETFGFAGSDHDDRPPPPINGDAVMQRLRDEAVRRFAQEALPTVNAVDVELADCGDSRCDQAYGLVRSGDLAGAERLYNVVVDQMQSVQTPDARRRTAAALFNRGVVRGYSNQLAEGIEDVRLAIASDPSRTGWPARLTALQELQAEIEAARFRGETTTGARPSR